MIPRSPAARSQFTRPLRAPYSRRCARASDHLAAGAAAPPATRLDTADGGEGEGDVADDYRPAVLSSPCNLTLVTQLARVCSLAARPLRDWSEPRLGLWTFYRLPQGPPSKIARVQTCMAWRSTRAADGQHRI
ncbi:hypothetical protein WHR41_07582 [Cladosporium halotolerans]|uniref:Uncharacterized protein n=1 Tax=Cladosporium halotolerans TaxID=1052096 RepID=A0AB34KHM4_9PEZI